MELAATRVWETHINLTPMYFNKAEGCYRSNPACLRVINDVNVLLKKKNNNFITNDQDEVGFSIYAQ